MQTVSTASAVPSLETDRLWLRGHRMDDFEQCAALWADPKVTQHILERPLTEEESWARFLRYVGHWAVFGFGYWVIVEKQTGDFAGEGGFADYKRAIQPSLKDVPEIGWVLASGDHGLGRRTFSNAHKVHHFARQYCFVSRGGEVWVPRNSSHDLPRACDGHVRA